MPLPVDWTRGSQSPRQPPGSHRFIPREQLFRLGFFGGRQLVFSRPQELRGLRRASTSRAFPFPHAHCSQRADLGQDSALRNEIHLRHNQPTQDSPSSLQTQALSRANQPQPREDPTCSPQSETSISICDWSRTLKMRLFNSWPLLRAVTPEMGCGNNKRLARFQGPAVKASSPSAFT